MDDDGGHYRAGGVTIILTEEKMGELRLLFSQIGQTCDAAFYIVRGVDTAAPTQAEFQFIKELTARLNVAVGRINSIVGG
jgi:hypothetical protein